MEIGEIKKKIMEKIEGGRLKSSRKKKSINLATLSAKMGIHEEDLLKLFNKRTTETATASSPLEEYDAPKDEEPVEDYNTRLDALEAENIRLKKIQEDSRNKSDSLLNQIEEKDKAIAQLQKNLASESISLIKDSEKEKSLINTAIEKSINEYRNKLASFETENKNLKSQHAETLKQNEEIFFQISEKDKDISELKKKFQADLDKLAKNKDLTLEKSLEEYRGKLPALETENKKLKKMHEDALKQNDSLLMRIEDKDREISALEKKAQAERDAVKKFKDNEKAIAEHRVEKEKAVANMEALRSKLYAATKDLKEQAGRITQLEEILKHRDKKLAESDKVYKNLENEKNDFAARFQAAEDARQSLEDRLKNLSADLEAKEKRVAETERLYNKNLESAKKDMDLQIQAIERSRKALEGKIAQLNIELEAKNRRIEETEDANRELDNLAKESALKLQAAESARSDLEERIRQVESELKSSAKKRESDKVASEESMAALKAEIEALKAAIREKEKSEEGLQENISRLESEIESRDKKIQADIKYCEGVVREVNDLRQKIKAYRLKVR